MTKGKPKAGKPKAPEMGGRGGSGAEAGVKLFTCPECNEEHAFPGRKQGEPLMCPKCAIPMKPKPKAKAKAKPQAEPQATVKARAKKMAATRALVDGEAYPLSIPEPILTPTKATEEALS